MGKRRGQVIHLKDYVKEVHGSLQDKIVVEKDIAPSEAVSLAFSHSPIQVVANGFDKNRVIQMKSHINQFLDSPSASILEAPPLEDKKFELEFFGNSRKEEFLSQIKTFLEPPYYSRVREDIVLIADELFTNFSKIAKDHSRPIKFGIDMDQEKAVIYCRDYFGQLDPKVMIRNIHRCFRTGVKEAIDGGKGSGAGIGSYLIYILGEGLAITVDPGEGTLVLVWMPIRMHHEDRVEISKSLFIIERNKK